MKIRTNRNQESNTWAFCLLITLGLSMTVGCSSSGEVSDEVSDEEAAALDEVPAEDAETASVPLDEPPVESNELQAASDLEEVPSPSLSEEVASAPLEPVVEPVQEKRSTGASIGESQSTGVIEDYVVQSGDTLMKIAFEKYGDLYQWKQIREWNSDRLTHGSHLTRGMVLKLERPSQAVSIERNGESYFIKEGDTLGLISGDVYGTSRKWKRLWENNRQMIRDPNKIFAGFTLYYTMTSEDLQEKQSLGGSGAKLGMEAQETSESSKQRSPAQQ